MSENTTLNTSPRPYWNSYWAGLLLGLVLLSAFVIMGRGLGASGASNSLLAQGIHAVAPEHAEANKAISPYLYVDEEVGQTHALQDWLVFQVLGVLFGGFISAALARRLKITLEKGPNISPKGRIIFAIIGGSLMGFGAKLGMGCTSGQALTGGSLLNVGSWAFMLCVFGGAYALAYFVRRLWV